MLKFSRITVTRGRIALTCLDLKVRLKTRWSTSDYNNIRIFHAAQVRSKFSSLRPTAATSCVEIVVNGIPDRSLKSGDTVELKDGDFLRIIDIPVRGNNLRGWRFCSTTKISGLPGNSPNEVCLITHTKDGDPQDWSKQCVEEVPRSEFVRKRRLILTNLTDPFQGIRTRGIRPESKPMQDQPLLICRWKYICCIKTNRRARPSVNVHFYSPDNEWAAIIRLKNDECDKEAKYRVEDDKLSDDWRGQSRKRANLPRSNNENIDRCDEDLSGLGLDELSLSNKKQRSSSSGVFQAAQRSVSSTYTFGDAFCGAGGASRGAAMANLIVQWGFDSRFNAYEAYRTNFPHAALLLSATDFIKKNDSRFQVDILHLSPPCQAFSPANTTPNPDKNKINIAASLTLGGILSVTRPRIVTLEQTPGVIVYKRNQGHYDEVIRQFTHLGFSIRWKVLKFAEYGLPQKRPRLIIIASRYIAVPTRSFLANSDMKSRRSSAVFSSTHSRHQTWSHTLGNCQRHDWHYPEGYADHIMFKNSRITRIREPYDGDKPLPHTILTKSNTWHYSGKRPHTHRELACLQGFPLTHAFGKLEVSRHIGNAVPPLVMKVLLEHIVKKLCERDGVSE